MTSHAASVADLQLDYASGIPIYVQIKDALRRAIVTGAQPLGTQLPTVRQLAVDLRINPNTVNRAYAELEGEGLLSSQRGRGTFVTHEKPPDGDQLRELEARVRSLVDDARKLGIDPAVLKAVLHAVLQEKET